MLFYYEFNHKPFGSRSNFKDRINLMDDPRSVTVVTTDNGVSASCPLIEKECPWIVRASCQP